MSNQNPFGALIYGITVLSAMAFKILPLPPQLQIWNPDWVLLVLIYWALRLPYQCGVFSAWTVGLLVDVLTARAMGQYALIYAVLTYLTLKFYKRVRFFPIMQQALFMFACLLLAHVLEFSIESIHNPARFQWIFLLPILSGTLIWAFAWLLLQNIFYHR